MYYIDLVNELTGVKKKCESDLPVIKWTSFPAKHLYDCIDYEPMIYNHSLLEITGRSMTWWTTQ